MGWLDRKDVLQWIDWVLAQDSEAEIVLHGVSMGAATTMMTAGEDTPEQVKVFVEDCGYTSVWDIFSSELKLRFGLPEFPILYTASATARAKAGYGFKEASALQQVQNCEKPMLFIHGTADDFIPYEMMGTLYNAKPGTNKATLTAEGAGHGEALDVLAGLPKGQAVQMALRTLSPQVILLDELGGLDEVTALEQGLFSGVDFVATLHAATPEEATMRPQVKYLMERGAVRVLVWLTGRQAPGCIGEVRFL